MRTPTTALLAVVAHSAILEAQSQNDDARLLPVPAALAPSTMESLNQRRLALERSIDSMNLAIRAFNGRCGSIREDDYATRNYCEGEYGRIRGSARTLEIRKTAFNNAVRTSVERESARNRPSIDRIYVPSPAVADEQATLDANPAAWLAAAQQAVLETAEKNRERTRAILAAIDELNPVPQRYQLTKLSDLTPGDILLIAPADLRRDASGAALGAAIQGADYLTRVASDLASGRVLSAAQQQVTHASHAVTFVKDVNGAFLFLDHTSEGSRIQDHRAFLREYGARAMYVARPKDVLGGRALWNAAASAARREKSDYGLLGGNVVCSERAGLAVARATGRDANRRLGPVDITPGDYFDTEGSTGKHFEITRLRITPTRERP